MLNYLLMALFHLKERNARLGTLRLLLAFSFCDFFFFFLVLNAFFFDS